MPVPYPASLSRRSLLRSAAATAAATSLPAWFLEGAVAQEAAPVKSPNARPRVALIGCGGMGSYDATLAQRFGDIVAVCDVDAGRAAEARAKFNSAEVFYDFRKVCESPKIDVIVNGTPDHWHTLVNLRALAAGKDVYAEKPLTLTIDEGKRLVAAVKAGGPILQTGSQQRSDRNFRFACELVRNGRLGKITRVQTWLPEGLRGGPFVERPAPQELNWDFWQGQTAARSYVPERCHRTFRYWWDYSGGTVTDWGAHHNDIALWGLGRDGSGPSVVEGPGLVETVPGGYTAPNAYRIRYAYDDGVEHICQSTSANSWGGAVVGKPKEGERYHGVKFEGADGWLFVTRDGKLEASDPELLVAPLPSDAVRLYASDDHMANFFECVATRKQPICPAEVGHRSVSLCHLGTIAIRLGRKLQWDPVAEDFVGDKEASGMLVREMRKPYDYDM